MNVFLTLVLLLVFFLLMQQGMMFFAFLALIAAVLALFSDMAAKRPRAGAATAGEGVVVQGGSIPPRMSIRVQPNWSGPKDGEEKAGMQIGEFFNFFGKTLAWVGRGFKKKGEK